VTSYEEQYARAKRLVAEDRAALLEELDRVLGAAEKDLGERLEETARLCEMALVARLDPWWAGPPQPNIRRAVRRVDAALHDELALELALRLAAAYARLGRVDDDAHRLARLAARVKGTDLGHQLEPYAQEAAGHLERALFLPSAEYAYELVKDLPPEQAFALAGSHLARGNASFAAQLVELRLVRALDDWYVGPALPNMESALESYRAERPGELQELAVLLARAYVKGGFVDLRARDHVLGILDGDEAHLLGPEEAIGFREYVDRDCFDYPYKHLYEQVKALDQDGVRALVRRHTKNGSLVAAQRLCEMVLVRAYSDWYFGDPTINVRGAIQRYLDAPAVKDGAEAGKERPELVDWAARFLAGLYAATLEGSSHARSLVHALVARAPDAPELVEAIHAAGIPADVPVTELHALYVQSVEIEARVDAFRARVEAAGARLTTYDRTAYFEVLRFLEQGEPTVFDDVSRTLGDLVEVVVPETLIRAATATIEDALRLAVTGASAALRRDRIVAELARRDPALRTLDRIRDAPLELLDEVAWSITLENRVAAALEGLGCGLGGPTLVLIDLPMLLLVNLNAIAAIATTYGFDIAHSAERDFAIALLAGGADALRQRLVLDEDEGERLGLRPTTARPGGRGALALHEAAAEVAGRIARQKVLQVIPIVGGAVGAGLNFHFTHTTTRTAVMAYRYRWLMRRFGS
jgi:hypothetical protein